jgi:hypothetical protein
MGNSATNLAVVGFVVSLPVVVYGILDLARIPAHLYRYTVYSRRTWITAILVGYACFGVGGLILSVIWLRSTERADLHDDLMLENRWDARLTLADSTAPVTHATHLTRMARRQDRKRRHRLAFAAVAVPVGLAIAATASRVG